MRAYSVRDATAAAILFVAALVHASAGWAQSGSATGTAPHIALEPVDPVTDAVEQNPLTMLRIAAINLKKPSDQGHALSGIVAAFLKRDSVSDATIDFNVISDPLWRARALVYFAEHARDKGRPTEARAQLAEASSLLDPEIARRDRSQTLGMISRGQAELGAFKDAVTTAVKVPHTPQRIELLLEIGRSAGEEKTKASAKWANAAFAEAFRQIQAFKAEAPEKIDLALATARAMIAVGDRKSSEKVLDFALSLVPKRLESHEKDPLPNVAAGYAEANRTVRAMEIVRALRDEAQRAYALTAVGRAIAETGSTDGAVPLFFLAIRDAETVTDPLLRQSILTRIVVEQARVGRHADAFATAGKIRDAIGQPRALFGMGKALVETGRPEEAALLVDYIPDIGMRSQLLAAAARYRALLGDRRGADEMLSRALVPTGARPDPATLAVALPLVYETQIELGETPGRSRVIDQLYRLMDEIPDTPAKVPVMTRMARAEAQAGQKEAAERSLGSAWRIVWVNKDSDAFPSLMAKISETQLELGEILLAYDAAARIPETEPAGTATVPDDPRSKALSDVAAEAARSGDSRLALRIARSIANPTARAGAYAAIAMALPLPAQESKRPVETSESR